MPTPPDPPNLQTESPVAVLVAALARRHPDAVVVDTGDGTALVAVPSADGGAGDRCDEVGALLVELPRAWGAAAGRVRHEHDDHRCLFRLSWGRRRPGRARADELEPRLLALASEVAALRAAAEARSGAQEEAETSGVLLELARGLAEAGSRAEVCGRVAAAVPVITGADRGSTWLWDPEAEVLRRDGHGATVRPADTPVLLDVLAGDGPVVVDVDAADERTRARMAESGVRWVAVVPIRGRGRFLGVVMAAWTSDPPPEGGRLGEHLVRRLHGVADQAATALQSAGLLEQVRHRALHDALTGLPNQVLLDDRIAQELAAAARSGDGVAVCYLDLDQFKAVNDRLGHAAGNELLIRVAARLAGSVRAADTVARIAGDEFCVVVPVPGSGEGHPATPVAEKLLAAFELPFVVAGESMRVTPSIGVAVGPDHGGTPDDLLRKADLAMYQAKQRGRAGWWAHGADTDEAARRRRELEASLGAAVERDELVLHWQPMVELATGTVVGAEALVRWRHPTWGLLEPAAFLDVAEESGLVAALDEWVLHAACAQGVAWRRLRPAQGRPLRVSVNVSGRHLDRRRLSGMVAAALDGSGLEPGLLELDIPERLGTEDRRETVQELAAVRRFGVSVALDGFGTGHPPVDRLRHVPADRVKLHPALVAEVRHAGEGAPVVAAAVAMADALGFEVAAVGVERHAQVAFLRRVGCPVAQGNLLGTAAPAAALERRLLSPVTDAPAEAG